MIKSLLLILSIFLFSACGGRNEIGTSVHDTNTTDNPSTSEINTETTSVHDTNTTDNSSTSEINTENNSSTTQLLSLDMFINSNSCSQVIDKVFYTICYDYHLKAAKAVGYTLSGDLVSELNIKKRPSFKVEWQIESRYRASTSDYVHSGYDRGHIAPDASFDWSQESLNSTYSLANIMPQARKVNRYTWVKAEKYERFIAVRLGSVQVLNVMSYSQNPVRIGQHGIAVPSGYYKILFNHEKNYSRCLYYANDNNIVTSEDILRNHEVSCKEIQY